MALSTKTKGPTKHSSKVETPLALNTERSLNPKQGTLYLTPSNAKHLMQAGPGGGLFGLKILGQSLISVYSKNEMGMGDMGIVLGQFMGSIHSATIFSCDGQ